MKKWMAVAAVGLFAIALLRWPEAAADGVREGLSLCFQTVVPSLFPFFVVISLLLQLGVVQKLQRFFAWVMDPLFHLSGAALAPLAAGLVGGYPSGAKTAAELYEQGALSKEEAELCLSFVNVCGPAFVLSYIGVGILGSQRAGVYLYLIHVLSALLTGMILCRLVPLRRRGTRPLPRFPAQKSFAEMFTAAVTGSFSSTLNICAFVVLFRTAAGILPAHLPAAVLGFFEMVTGAAALHADAAGFITAAGLISWGGLSVHFQTLSVLGGLRSKWHWIGKAMQAALSVLLAAAAVTWLSPSL